MQQELVYGGFWRRFLAATIDWLILIIPVVAVEWAMPFVGSFFISLIYFPIFESSPAQATPGKYVMGLRVFHESGQKLSLPRALIRFIMRYVSAMLLFFGYWIQLFTAKRQTLHDLIAGALVCRHNFETSPDWIDLWMKQMRFVLRVDEMPPVDTVSRPSNRHTVIESIEKLHELYRQGALTEDEYQSKKSEFLKNL